MTTGPRIKKSFQEQQLQPQQSQRAKRKMPDTQKPDRRLSKKPKSGNSLDKLNLCPKTAFFPFKEIHEPLLPSDFRESILSNNQFQPYQQINIANLDSGTRSRLGFTAIPISPQNVKF